MEIIVERKSKKGERARNYVCTVGRDVQGGREGGRGAGVKILGVNDKGDKHEQKPKGQ